MKTIFRFIQKSFGTQADVSLSLLRVILGMIFFKEGTGKLLGWFGGGGWSATCAYFQSLGIPFPELNAFLVGITEAGGGLALLVGFLTRFAVIPIGITMVVAILTAHRDGGYHYPLLILMICFVFLRAGSGYLSLDYLAARFLDRRSQ